MQNKAVITYSIEQKPSGDPDVWNLVALHNESWKRSVLTLPTKTQAQRALRRIEAIMAAQDV
jgi:hypothetical protein